MDKVKEHSKSKGQVWVQTAGGKIRKVGVGTKWSKVHKFRTETRRSTTIVVENGASAKGKLSRGENVVINPGRKISEEEKAKRLERRQLAHKVLFLKELIAGNYDDIEIEAKDDKALYDEYSKLTEEEKLATLKQLQQQSYGFKL